METWLPIIAAIAAVLVGGFTAYFAVKNPAFWLGMGKAALLAAWPYLLLLFKRMPSEDEAAWRAARKANRPAPKRKGGGNPHPDEKD